MDFSSALAHLNYLAIFAAALSAFLIGGLWYSPVLFIKYWLLANGFTEEEMKAKGKGHPAFVFGMAFVLAFISAFVLALFIGHESDAAFGAMAGSLVGIGWVATSLGIIYLFENRPLLHFIVNAGYLIVTFTVMGVILGAWH